MRRQRAVAYKFLGFAHLVHDQHRQERDKENARPGEQETNGLANGFQGGQARNGEKLFGQ